MFTQCNGFVLDENSGVFDAEDGRKVEFHNARIYDTDAGKLFKVNVPKGKFLPEPQERHVFIFNVNAGEKYCRLEFDSCE